MQNQKPSKPKQSFQAEVTMNVTIDRRYRDVDLFWIVQRSYRLSCSPKTPLP